MVKIFYSEKNIIKTFNIESNKTILDLSKIENSLNNNKFTSQVKTTNVNVLLNRVRLEERKTFNKKILISLFLITSISLMASLFIIKS